MSRSNSLKQEFEALCEEGLSGATESVLDAVEFGFFNGAFSALALIREGRDVDPLFTEAHAYTMKRLRRAAMLTTKKGGKP